MSPSTSQPRGRLLLFDVGNTHTHVGLVRGAHISKHVDLPTALWSRKNAPAVLRRFVGPGKVIGVSVCSVVPKASVRVLRVLRKLWPEVRVLPLNPSTLRGVGIDYPKPESIGQDRLANALAVRLRHGAPSLVVDFGTAVTFDVVDQHGNYIGGVIAPGLAAMTEYLHEKTALLPRIEIRDIDAAVGRSTEEAMLIGAVHGYRGLVRELISRLKKQLGVRRLPVVATGGYARLMAKGVPEITDVQPLLTLEGLRQHWELSH